MYRKVKRKVYNLIREDDENDLFSNIFDGIIITLIILNVIMVIIDTFDTPKWYQEIANIIETVSVVIFTIEYLLRLWVADLKYPQNRSIIARCKYIFSFMAIIDLLAILPFYIPFIFPIDLRVLRALRIFRLFRLLKFNRYTSAFATIVNVIKKKAHQLISSMVVVFVLMIIASILMYNVEHDAQPEVFDNAFSGLWWAIATFTTVGYGDIYPITVAGKFLSALMAILGIGLVAVPTGIISAGFIENVDKNESKGESSTAIEPEKKFCPYCGNKIDK